MNVEALPTWRPLKALLGGLVDVPERLEVSDITQDSRSVTPGAAFLACQGRTHHGLEFAHSAVAAGARRRHVRRGARRSGQGLRRLRAEERNRLALIRRHENSRRSIRAVDLEACSATPQPSLRYA